MDANQYIMRKLRSAKNLYLHERLSHITPDGPSSFVISTDKYRFNSLVLTTAGLPDDAAERKSILDERFGNVVATLAEHMKRFGVV